MSIYRHHLPQIVGKALVATMVCISLLHIAGAQVMSSTNYKIQSDSVNTGGGRSTSTNYTLESTAGEVATGNSTSTNFQLRAGYQQMQEVFLSMSVPADVSMTSLGGIVGGISTGSTSVVVVTDSPSGYQITIHASSSPAMRNAQNATIADYQPAGGVPDFAFINTATSAQLAFSPEGTGLATRYKDNGSTCGVGSSDTSQRCWDGLSTTDRVIVSATAANQPNGATTTVRFQVGIGGSIVVPSGQYTATTTLTALPL